LEAQTIGYVSENLGPVHLAEWWQEQSRMLWSRIQTASTVEAAVVVGAYTLWAAKRSGLAAALLFFGALLLVIVSLLAWRDGQYLQAIQDKLGDHNMPQPKKLLGLDQLKGRRIGAGVPLGLAVLDLVAIVFVAVARP
jgi:cytochrome c oxidase subunit IV